MQKLLVIFSIFVLLISCAFMGTPDRPNPVAKKSGFLPDYSKLQLEVDTKEAKIYRYINPKAKRNNYHAVILEPVVLYQPVKESNNKEMANAVDESSTTYLANNITKDKVNQVRNYLDNYLKEVVSKKMPITNTAAPGVAKLSVAITGAEVDAEGFKVRNVLPISAAIRLASMASGYDSKTPVLIIEVKVTDSSTGELLGEAYNIVSGESFRQEINTIDQFEELAKGWLDTAVKYASSRNPDNARESMPSSKSDE